MTLALLSKNTARVEYIYISRVARRFEFVEYNIITGFTLSQFQTTFMHVFSVF